MDDIKQLFLSMRAMLSGAVSGIVPPHEIEDIVQETYVKLCLVKNRDAIEHPTSYMYKMARNLARDYVKRAEYRLSDSWDNEELGNYANSHLEGDEVLEHVVSKEKFARFCDAVSVLPLQCRRVFVLKKVYGYSQRDIAKELGLSESTVEKHVALAMRRCAQQMDEEPQASGLTHDLSQGTHHE